jgi:hypothetical protein
MNKPWEQWATVIGSDGMDYLPPDSQAFGYGMDFGDGLADWFSGVWVGCAGSPFTKKA